MVAVLGGVLALLLGLTVLLLPVLATELSRPRDSVWGAVILLLGLVLVTSSDRLTGAPMLGVLCGGLLIGRLGLEVSQARWRQLSPEEQQRLWSLERWQTSLQELTTALVRLMALAAGSVSALGTWIAERRRPRTSTKRWVRQEVQPAESETQAAEPAASEAETTPEPQESAAEAVPVVEVTSLDGVDELLQKTVGPGEPEQNEPPEQQLLHQQQERKIEAETVEPPPAPQGEAG